MMRIQLGHELYIDGSVWVGRDGHLKMQAVTKKKQAEFERFVRHLYVGFQAHPQQTLTPKEFLALLPRRLHGLTWAVEMKRPVERRRIQPLTMPAIPGMTSIAM